MRFRRRERGQPHVPGSLVLPGVPVDPSLMYEDFDEVIVGWPPDMDPRWTFCMELGNPIPVAVVWDGGYPEPDEPQPITIPCLVWRWS